MMADFLRDFHASLPARLSFEAFSRIVCSTCINSSQLRMKITKTDLTSTSQEVVVSQVSTIILSYLTPTEQVQKAQLTCRKWYHKFLPQVMPSFPLNFTPWQSKRFRLAYEQADPAAAPLYLALVTGQSTDTRESCGRTYYVSAGSSQEHQDFAWTIDANGALADSQDGPDGSKARLAAHRTYINDCVGKTGTYVISTVFGGHENAWRLERIGDLDHKRYMICLSNSKCVKDNINQVGWAITAAKPKVASAKAADRDDNSRYVYVSNDHRTNRSAAEQQRDATPSGSLNHFPIWNLELMA